MTKRFHIGKGRYQSIVSSRYQDHTQGPNGFVEAEDEHVEHGTYGALLFDKRWISKRQEILNRDNHSCVICGVQDRLQVHHRQYHYIRALKKFKSPWDYDNDLMISLCERCHTRGHSKFKVPNIYL